MQINIRQGKKMSNLTNAIKSNLISGGAYSLILKALIVTVAITVIAWIIAAAVGAVFSYFMCYEITVVSGLAKALSFLFRSTPVLLLMLFFNFGIFGSVNVPAALLAAVSIGLYGAGHFSEIIMKSVSEHEDFKNREIRRRLRSAFFVAALPEGTKRSLFQVKRLVIQLMQWTTVAGYISANELTKVMQQIGNRTMYPLFSIAFSIIVYLVATIIIELIFSVIEKKLNN